MLGWSAFDLADYSGVGGASIKLYDIQKGIPSAHTSVLLKIKTTLENQGIEFTGDPLTNPGVTLNLEKWVQFDD